MKILGIDTSSSVASAAIVEDDTLIAEYTVNLKKTHSQILLPMIDEIKEKAELDLNTLDAIAIAGGPGSFTGLRIGSATAKGLGLALDIPIVNVPTLEAMAYNLIYSDALICPIMDARRNQVYTGVYKSDGEKLDAVKKQCAIAMDDLINYLNKCDEKVIFLGDGVPVFKNIIEEKLLVIHDYAEPHLSRQRASAVAALGMKFYKQGKIETATEHVPEYLRLSQAERERMEQEKAQKND